MNRCSGPARVAAVSAGRVPEDFLQRKYSGLLLSGAPLARVAAVSATSFKVQFDDTYGVQFVREGDREVINLTY